MKKRKNVIIPLRRSAIMPEGLYYIIETLRNNFL